VVEKFSFMQFPLSAQGMAFNDKTRKAVINAMIFTGAKIGDEYKKYGNVKS
jgi:hypothetical protein